jgi:hypothetical protein
MNQLVAITAPRVPEFVAAAGRSPALQLSSLYWWQRYLADQFLDAAPVICISFCLSQMAGCHS